MYVAISDITRYAVVISALFIGAVLLRLVWLRVQRNGLRSFYTQTSPPHVLSILGMVTFMGLAIARRFDTLGEPGDVYLWVVAFGMALLTAGVLFNVQFTLTPPWRRR